MRPRLNGEMVAKGGNKRTIGRPGTRTARQRTSNRGDTSSLEPHITSSLPRVDICTIWHLRHVKLHRSEVRYTCRGYEAQSLAGSNGGSAGAGSVLEAPHIWACNRRHATIGLVVLSLSDSDPFLGFGDTSHDYLREAVSSM